MKIIDTAGLNDVPQIEEFYFQRAALPGNFGCYGCLSLMSG